MAAAAKAPGPADARIPCPLCGGLIHPIAGRCKHCKGDVSNTRSSKPAPVALPALQVGPTNGQAIKPQHPANAHMPVPLAVRSEEPSQGILPPRTTGRMQATGTARQASWKSWPVIVIAIAVVAIIAAVILMVMPQNESTKVDSKTLAPPPAPERMDTQSGPQGSVDPWKNTPSQPNPPAPPAQPSAPSADPDDPNAQPNLADPFRDPNNSVDNMAAMTGAIMKHACDRLKQCPNADASDVSTLCTFGQLAAPTTPPPSCGAANRCLSKVDALPCDNLDQNAALNLIMTAQDCMEALRC